MKSMITIFNGLVFSMFQSLFPISFHSLRLFQFAIFFCLIRFENWFYQKLYILYYKFIIEWSNQRERERQNVVVVVFSCLLNINSIADSIKHFKWRQFNWIIVNFYTDNKERQRKIATRLLRQFEFKCLTSHMSHGCVFIFAISLQIRNTLEITHCATIRLQCLLLFRAIFFSFVYHYHDVFFLRFVVVVVWPWMYVWIEITSNDNQWFA